MGWSWSVGAVAGIPVRVHWTLIAMLAFVGLAQGAGAIGTLIGAVVLFASVVAHEVAHALVARGYGIRTRDIVLTPIGGIARLEGMPATGRAEVAIAIAGPAASLAIAGAAWLASGWVAAGGVAAMVLGTLAWSNAMLGLFNLVPAFPMDGGRVLRGALHEAVGLRRATDVATRLGRVVAIAMGVAGAFFVSSPSLVFIAIFVWIASGREQSEATLRDAWDRAREHAPRAWDARGRPIPVEIVDAAPHIWAPRRVVVVSRGT